MKKMKIYPTLTDVITASYMVRRVFLRKTFDSLRKRKTSKYFKHIIIENIPWKNLPSNVPQYFLKSNPFDFEVKFTTLGCNTLKCYADVKSNCQDGPFIINEQEYACSTACYEVYSEVYEFLKERFPKASLNTPRDFSGLRLPFESWSIRVVKDNDDNEIEDNYCGIQLSTLKTLGLRPSARWHPSNEKDNEKYQKNPTAYAKLKSFKTDLIAADRNFNIEAKGLIDAPPLKWNCQLQQLEFTPEYCQRFRKYYDFNSKTCLSYTHRKILNFILGTEFVNQISDRALVDPTGTNFVLDHTILQPQVDQGYTEKKVSQQLLEKQVYVNNPDLIVKSKNIVFIKTDQDQKHQRERISETINKEYFDLLYLIKEGSITLAEIEAGTQIPKIISRLLKFFSEKIITAELKKSLILMLEMNGIKTLATDLLILVVRSSLIEMSIQLSVKMLTLLTSTISVVFMVGIFTMIPDIYFAIANIGGYENEMNAEYLKSIRNSIQNEILRFSKDKLHLSQFLKIFLPQNQSSITTIEITPEIVYFHALYEIIRLNPHCIGDINHDGTIPNIEDELRAISKFLRKLKTNSLGQVLDLTTISDSKSDDIRHKEIIDSHKKISETVIKMAKKYYYYPLQVVENENREIEELIFDSKLDISIFILALIFLALSLIVWKYYFQPYLIILSGLFFTYWTFNTHWLHL